MEAVYATAMAPPKRMGRPSGQTKEQTRTRIIESALLCFSRYGYGGASNRLIAEGAHVTTGTLYRHFPTKADIYISTFRETNDWLQERLRAVVNTTDCLRENMLAVARVSSALIAEKPSMARFLPFVRLDSDYHPELAAVRDLIFLPNLADTADSSEVGVDGVPGSKDTLELYTAVLATLVGGAARYAILSDSPDPFGALMSKFERAMKVAGAQVIRSSTAVPGVDYRLIGTS